MIDILIADDEAEIVELIRLYIDNENINIHKAFNGEEALRIIENNEIALGIIDIMMPKVNGFQVVEAIRKKYTMPLIILSAREDYSDKIHGLQIGADDYMTKPFNAMELKARVEAHLRRYLTMAQQKTSAIINIEGLDIDLDACTVIRDGNLIELTPTEYQILALLVKRAGKVQTKQQIYEGVWGEQYYGDENTIRIHLSNLRDKIEINPKKPEIIKTVRGLGYKVDRGDM